VTHSSRVTVSIRDDSPDRPGRRENDPRRSAQEFRETIGLTVEGDGSTEKGRQTIEYVFSVGHGKILAPSV